jgi:CRISPR-associated protein Cmr1
MKTHDYCVSFETITPLWFGNSWSENAAPFKASSLIGSLRFWFEVICYFSGITTNKDYANDNERTILKADLNAKEFPEKLVERLNNNKLVTDTSVNNLVHEVLTSLSMPLPARVFGCTGWQGLIRVKKVEIKKSDEDFSVYFFPKPNSYYGSFNVIFDTNEETKQYILYPLLKFIENYGFLGKGWNLGYGRVKVYFEDGEKQYDRFSNYAGFNANPVKFIDIIKHVSKKEDYLSKINVPCEKKLIIWDTTENSKNIEIEEIIKELIREKFYMRRSLYNHVKRHEVFGTTSSPSHGSKILPWIYKDGKKLNYGFVSIAGILNIG